MVYTRGSNEEYDRWAKLTEDPGWAWENVAQYYFKVPVQTKCTRNKNTKNLTLQSSRLVPPVDGRDITGEVNPSDHGDGPILVSVPAMPSEIDNRVFTTSKESGSEFPFNLDWQSGNAVGVGKPVVSSPSGNYSTE